jgi:hypothetical protein
MITTMSQAITVVLTSMKSILGPVRWPQYRRAAIARLKGLIDASNDPQSIALSFELSVAAFENALGIQHSAAYFFHNDLVFWTRELFDHYGGTTLPLLMGDWKPTKLMWDQYHAVAEGLGLSAVWFLDMDRPGVFRADLLRQLEEDQREAEKEEEREMKSLSDLFMGMGVTAEKQQADELVDMLKGLDMGG